MRTVTLQSVYEAIVRRQGLDPSGDAINHDTARAIIEHVNDRVRTVFAIWPFPELSHTEERAFRQVWNGAKQFYRNNVATGKPDELFYIPNTTYYKVKATAPNDPPVGTVPTNTTYFSVLETVDTYIEFDQPCKRSMGQVLGIYKSNPRLNGCDPSDLCLCFRPSELGIDVCCPAGPTVFVHYMIPAPRFTMKPYIAGKTYNRGDRVFWTEDGDCYRAILAGVDHLPSDTTYWALEPMPELISQYVKAGAYADTLLEDFQPVGYSDQKAGRAALAEAEAERFIQGEIDTLIAQGQRFYYTRPLRYIYGVCVTQPWTGGTVSELTDVCVDEQIYRPPAVPAQDGLYYFSNVNSLKTTTATLVATVRTATFLVGTMAVISTGQHFRLDAGAADGSDPGQGAPADYDTATNNKHWTEVL